MRKTDYIQKLVLYFRNHSLWLRLLNWAKTHSLPGLKRIPLYNLVLFIIKETEDDDLVTRANSVAFSFFMALFPSIIVLFTLLAYTPLYENFDDVLRESIHEVMPGDAGKMIFSTLEDIITIPRSGLLSAGFFLAIWFASNGMLSLMRGFEKDYETTFIQRNIFQKRLIAIQLTFLMALILVASVIFVILGNTILGLVFTYVKADWITRMIVFSFRWVVILMLFYAGISTIFRFGAPTAQKIPFFNPGALLATILSICTSWGFSFYVDNFGNYNKLYGSIGTLIVLMVWIQINCMIILIGYELNAGIAVLRDLRRLERQLHIKTP